MEPPEHPSSDDVRDSLDPLIPGPSQPSESTNGLVAAHLATVDAQILDRVAYALAHNRRTFIKSLRIRPLTSAMLLEVKISADWAVSNHSPVTPFSVTVDLATNPDEWVSIDVRNCRLDDIALSALEEDAPARITIELFDYTSGARQIEHFDISIMSRTQWIGDLPEITAAFVQPNHPAVPGILRDASRRLKAVSGSESIDGYQAVPTHPERPAQIARAVFEALADRVDHYINPPASFNSEGQKLRPLDEVLENRHGTCIDLACAYASCLEQTGLHPIVFLVHGHAFAGIWLRDKAMPISVVGDFAAIINRIDVGDIVAIETTALATGESFDEAVAATRKHLTERSIECPICLDLAERGNAPHDLPHLEAAVDITACRRDLIRPIPARVVEGDRIIIVHDPGGDEPPIRSVVDRVTGEPLPSEVPVRVQRWKNALLDLSFRNRLLKFDSTASGLTMVAPPGFLGKIEDAINAGTSISLTSLDALPPVRREAFSDLLRARFGIAEFSRAVSGFGIREVQHALSELTTPLWNEQNDLLALCARGTVPTKAKNLIRDARTEQQDSGVNNLHLAFGTLRWSVAGSSVGPVTSPIFLVPVRMKLARGALVPEISLDRDATTTVNYCLVEALRARAELDLEWFRTDIRDHAGLGISAGLNHLRDEISDHGLDQQFGFEVLDSISIGLLRFNKIRLWKDLDEHWEHFAKAPLIHHFINRVGEPFNHPSDTDSAAPVLDDSILLNPQPADGAQSKAILQAVNGNTFVLEGPPGTGKSQTITNLLANALAQGLTVLFVAEKQVALDVVRERLDAVGLMPFCLDLHDKGSTAKQIREQLLAALEHEPESQLDRWERESLAFSTMAKRLADYRSDLHGTEFGGMTYYDAYRRLVELGEGEMLRIGREALGASTDLIDELRHALADIESYTTPADPRPGHPWAMVRHTDFGAIDRSRLAQTVTSLLDVTGSLATSSSPLGELARAAESIDDTRVVVTLARLADAGVVIDGRVIQQASRRDWPRWIAERTTRAAEALERLGTRLNGISEAHVETDLTSLRSEVQAAARSFVLFRKGRIRKSLGPFAAAPHLADIGPKDVDAKLAEIIEDFVEVRRIAADLHQDAAAAAVMGSSTFPQVEQLANADTNSVHLAALATRCVIGDRFALELTRIATQTLLFPPDDQHQLTQLVEHLDALGVITRADDEGWCDWLANSPLLTAIERSSAAWSTGAEDRAFIHLNRWVALVDRLEILDAPGLREARKEILAGRIVGHAVPDAFERGFADVVLATGGEHLQFDIFDHHDHNRRVSQFQSLLRNRQDLLRSVIPKMLHDRRSFDASARAGRIGQFRTDLRSTARRGSRSIREIIQKYPDLITELTPCFLMSPDSVAKFVPPGAMTFDLVVFDEASQITVADAIGSIGRARSAVIVGDSRQMPPTMVAQARVDGGDDDDFEDMADTEGELVDEPVPEDAESILDESVASGVPQEMLSWHYRSRDEVLISFSNDHYYKGQLSSFPAPALVQPSCGIEYHRVHGQFDHGRSRTNLTEAEAIVADVRRRVNDPEQSRWSIGIVTLNIEQRKLMLDLLAATDDPKILELLESDDGERELFVLNLESVQGRERDVILLGTAFSKRADGSPMPLSFGPLTHPGGERRLNVAVTRARRQMVVYSSFDPNELDTAKSTGLVHLRNYLTLAQRASADPATLDRSAVEAMPDPYVDEIAAALAERGYDIRRGYGLSAFKVDIAVAHPHSSDHFVVGILADGRAWNSRLLVLDRDAVPVNVLSNLMGWPAVLRVWLPSWRANRDDVLETLERSISDAIEAVDAGSFGVSTTESTSAADTADVVLEEQGIDSSSISRDDPLIPAHYIVSRTRPDERPYSTWTPRHAGTTEELEVGGHTVADVIAELIENEGPIEVDELCKRVARAFGLQSVHESRLKALRPLVPAAQIVTNQFGAFAYPKSLVDSGVVSSNFIWYRRPSDGRREYSLVAPHELANLAKRIATDGGGIERQDLAHTLLDELGYSRMVGDTINAVLERIDWMVAAGLLRDEGGHLYSG